MAKITLQAGSTFWFDYPDNPPARHIFEGQSFEIDSVHFPEYALVGKELLAGEMPEPTKPLAERVFNKIKGAFGLNTPEPTRWPCEHCDKVFNAPKGLEIHMRNAHKDLQNEPAPEPSEPSPEPAPEPGPESESGDGDHKCPHCRRSFGTERGLQIHIGHIHENHNPEE